MLDAALAPGGNALDAAATPSAAGGVRPCTIEDIPAVARLFRATFTDRLKAGGRPLEVLLRRELFEHPWRDPDLPSLVFAGPDGAVSGFIAVRPLRLLFDGAPVSAAVGGTLMVDKSIGNPVMGARLLRSYLNGVQDLSLSESANEISQVMWEKLGGRTEAAYSMEWLRVIKPAGLALASLTRRFRMAALLRPFAGVFDWCAARVRANPLRIDATFDEGSDVDAEDLVDALLALSLPYRLRPDWDRDSLLWFVAQASEKERYGPLVCRVVRDRKGGLAGAYLYCVRPGGVAFVLDIFAAPKSAERVVDDLFADAKRRGAVAIRGRVQPEFADLLLRRRAVFLHASSMVVHARRGDLFAPIHGGEALITGLAGESWSALIGGLFI
ncbi:hypothetical protein [Bauldia litoralis]|uniref:Uncharacterized protein n=1 Tax=Bauldia litoralis TaxID=665467 RepID=A0A1G6AH14_9HYPH|nr:hypothetical protein [Bauldia litoralis]SDB07685.1 hypothetical protein SAMN02982931_00606 [Bauldia litoralis]